MKKKKYTNRPRRIIKVQYAFYDKGYNNNYPVIKIAGKYLRSYGFEIGDNLQVSMQHGLIIISLTPQKEEMGTITIGS